MAVFAQDTEARARRMRDMVRRLDVDVLELAYAKQGEVYEIARKNCLTCPTSAYCVRWLAGERVSDQERPTFCPNLLLFERFKYGAAQTGERHADEHADRRRQGMPSPLSLGASQ